MITKNVAKEILLTNIWETIEYWDKLEDRTQRQKLEGLAFSILASLDGCSAGVPEFAVIPMDGTENISGSLHEAFHYFRPDPENI